MYDSPLLFFFLARARKMDVESVIAMNDTRNTDNCPTGPRDSHATDGAFLAFVARKHLSK
jgi:hypothetical protein